MSRFGPTADILRIALCQTLPGRETAVYQSLKEKHGYSICFLSLSEYDLAALIPCTLADIQGDSFQSFAPSLREYQEVLCFSWADLSQPLSALVNAGPAKAISFLKINETLTRSLGIRIEQAFLRWLRARFKTSRDGVCVIPYGTLSWTEVALIWGASNFTQIIERMVHIRELRASELSHFLRDRDLSSKLKGEPVVIFTHSLPCVEADLSSGTIYRSPHLREVVEPTHARLIVMCASGADRYLARAIQSEFGAQFTVSTTYGHYDMVIEPTAGQTALANLAELIQFVRSLGPQHVHSTQVQMFAPISPTQESGNVSPPTVLPSEPSDEILLFQTDLLQDLQRFEARLDNPLIRFSPLLSQMLSRYQAVTTVKELDGLIDDLVGFLVAIFDHVETILFKNPLLPTVDQELRNAYDVFETAHRVFQLGFDQRISGAQVGMANAARAFTGVRSAGIQRILTAANALPRGLLWEFTFRGIREPLWTGFTVFGYEGDTLRLEYGVMNIPAGNLLEPAEWWMLCHEAGHEFVQVLRLLERSDVKALVDEALYSNKRALSMRGVRTLCTREEIQDLIDEILAEIFSFQFGFGRDWEFYFSTLWDFLQDYLEGRLSLDKALSYLIRHTFVYFYHLEVEGALGRNEKVQQAIDRGRVLGSQLYSQQEREAWYAEGEETLENNIRHRAFARYGSVADVVRKHLMPPIIDDLAPKVASLISQVDPELVAHWYLVLEPLRSLLIEVFRQVGIEPATYSISTGLEKAQRHLRRGVLCLEKDIRPMEIVLALKHEKTRRLQGKQRPLADEKWTQAVLAGLLSLWHKEKTMDSAMSDESTATG